jgi:parvulin-like peptidyl-prolyl isomerase
VDETGKELPADKKEAQRKTIDEVLKKARAGDDFAKLAKEYSEDPGSKDRGGEYTFGRKQMVPEFETAAFSLATNQISDVITTQFGYHIIKLYEKMPARKIELEKVSNEVTDYLKQQQAMKVLPDYMEKAMKEAGVEIVDERLKPIEPKELNIPAPAPGAIPAPTEKKK